MRIKLSCILLLLICLAADVSAQRRNRKKKPKPVQTTQQRPESKDTALKGATIEIIQNYTPEIKTTPKPEFTPTLPPADNKLPVFSYDVPQQSLYYTYGSLPIRPLALGKQVLTSPFENYIKLGGGNLSTLYLDAGIGSLKGENFETAIQVRHLSQTGDFNDQKTTLTGANADGSLHTSEHLWHGNIDFSRNQYHYYGYNHERFNYGIDSVKQAFTNFRIGFDVKNGQEGFKNINYHPAISASSYSDRFDAAERTINIDAPFSYHAGDELDLQVGIHAALTRLEVKSNSIDNNIFKLTPALFYKKDAFSLFAGLYPAIGKNANYLLPDINASYKLPGSQVTILAGFQSLLRQNTYEQLSSRNPYMYNTYLVQQTKTNEVFGGIQGSAGTHLSFTARAGWKQFADMPLFINDTASADKKQFLVVYDKVNSLSLQGSVRYQVANTFSAGFCAVFNGYNAEVFRHAWHEPGIDLKADVLIKPIEHLTVTAYLSILDGIYAVDRNNITVKLKPVAEIGGGAEYSFIPRLSAFLQVNNLLNNKYQRWYGYNAYGINIYGGLRLKF